MNFLKLVGLSSKKESALKEIEDILSYIDLHDLYPDLRIVESAVDPEVMIDGRKVLMFASNNYLGLATHPRVKEAAIKTVEKYGVGSTGSRLLSGNLDIHLQLERKLADFKGGQDAIVFPAGFSTNLGTISAIMKPLKINLASFMSKKGIILSDELNHASIVDGCRQSGQEVHVYKHKDLHELEGLLKKYKNRRKLIITDSIFSMDGDIAPLDKICALAKKYNSMVMIDEAHSTGVLGENGRGATEHFNLKIPDDIQIVMGTLSKAIGVSGGYVVGSRDLIKYLRVGARSYMFSTAMSPVVSGAAIESINVIQSEKNILKDLWSNVSYLREGLEKLGFDTLESESPIIPILLGEDKYAIEFSRELFKKGVYAPCVRWPAVKRNKAIIRFTVMATHSKEQIDYLLKTCSEIREELKKS